MSYDIVLFRIPEGAEPTSAYQELMERQEQELELEEDAPLLSEAARTEMDAVAEALRAWRPKLETAVEPPPVRSILMTDEDLQIQFYLSGGSVAVAIPYFRERGEEMMAAVAESLEIIARTAGYRAYDPQLERVVTAADVKQMGAQYRRMDDVLPEIMNSSRTVPAERKPWWKFW